MSQLSWSLRRSASLSANSTYDGSKHASDSLAPPPSSYFGELTLTWQQLAERLSADVKSAFVDFVHGKQPLSKENGNRVADAVYAWAVENKATFYAHWFHPLTGIPSDKHDGFIDSGYNTHAPTPQKPIEDFSGSRLLQGEPDASSFPSGGLRATHEARGYTVWDPTSPIFIRPEGKTRTMCIPCAYVSWTGYALDAKTPLLRALDALNREATSYFSLVTGSSIEGIYATLGAEQEYFLIDKSFMVSRPDIVMAGRTLLGAPLHRGQQLEENYFGPITARVQAFITEAEQELFRLGIPVKTRHREVAPAQFEIAPVFEEANVAVDHNILVMDVLRRTADKHGLVCLLHEKPFANINGSGKHNNWSMSTFDGENLLDPTNNPAGNVRFLAALAATFTALHRHNAVLRATVASAGNDHRLGANEAPPAILSIFLGSGLDKVVTAVQEGKTLDVDVMPELVITSKLRAKKDLTDRNRTAPFAFTGNKFEFRAVGASENPAWPMTVLNAAVADACSSLRARLQEKLSKGQAHHDAVMSLVREVFQETAAVRFEGNCYSAEWHEEAAKRGLPILKNTAAALPVLGQHDKVHFLTEMGVFKSEELSSRHEIYAERYVKIIEVEARTLADVATAHVLPALEAQIVQTGKARTHLAQAGVSGDHLQRRLSTLGNLAEGLQASVAAVNESKNKLHAVELFAAVDVAANEVIPANEALRRIIDTAETVVSDDLWPLPKYREMLFLGV